MSFPQVSQQLNLLKQDQTSINYGNQFTLPVSGGLLYMELIYIERPHQGTSFPQLAKVLVSSGGKTGYDARLDVTLSQVFGPAGGSARTPSRAPRQPAPSPSASLGSAISDVPGGGLGRQPQGPGAVGRERLGSLGELPQRRCQT